MLLVIYNPNLDAFLALPEGKREGARADVRPLPPEWTALDHAARFDGGEQAASVINAHRLGAHVRLLTLREAWGVAA